MTRKCMLWLVAWVVLGCGACQSPAPTGRSHTLLRQRSVTPAVAFSAAEQALRERFRIQVRDPVAGLLRTEPVITEAPPEPARVVDTLRTRRRVRKVVEVRVEPEGDGVAIGCKAVIEENQAREHRLFAREHSLSDVPSDTPADREAAVTAEQDAVWRVIRRDKTLEGQICQAINELLSEPGPRAGGPP